MKRASWASFSLFLLLLCFLQEGGVEAIYNYPVIRSKARNHDAHDIRGNVHTTTITTTTSPRTEERRDGNIHHGRSSGNGVTCERQERSDEGSPSSWRRDSQTYRFICHKKRHGRSEGKSERSRTHHHYGGGTIQRTNSGPPPTRSSNVDKRKDGNSHTRYGATANECHHGANCNRNGMGRHDENDTKSISSKESTEKLYGRHSSTQKANVHHRSPPKNASNLPSLEDRSEGEEEELAVQATTEAHPIGLISALDGRGTKGRSMDLNPRELDSTHTTTIIAVEIIVLAGLVISLYCLLKIAQMRRQETDESVRLIYLFQYLDDFDSDDIDIQQSALGGFHVGYLNELSKGINKKKQSDQETDSTVSSNNSENGTGLSQKV